MSDEENRRDPIDETQDTNDIEGHMEEVVGEDEGVDNSNEPPKNAPSSIKRKRKHAKKKKKTCFLITK